MNIEIWSDFVCPFCYIGEKRLFDAMEEVSFKDELSIEFKSFELDPQAKIFDGTTIDEAIAKKYGVSVEQARQNNSHIKEQAALVGLDFNFDTMKPTNTLDAHRLAKFAKSQGKELEMSTRLFSAYFTEGSLISDLAVLEELAQEVGLNIDEVKAVLEDKSAYLDEVRSDETQAHQFGISSVPYIVIDNKYAIKGAQPLETFVGALEKAWSEKHPKPVFEEVSSGEAGMNCDGDGCVIPK